MGDLGRKYSFLLHVHHSNHPYQRSAGTAADDLFDYPLKIPIIHQRKGMYDTPAQHSPAGNILRRRYIIHNKQVKMADSNTTITWE
jgi:hypothetical protein